MFSLVFLSGCSDWLNVTPQSEIDQDQLFAEQSGYEDALIELYLKAADASLYGKKLTFYDIEFLAQQFKPNSDDQTQQALSAYDYTSSGVQSSMETIFRNMYNAIANCNNLIQHLESTTLVFDNNRKELILAEALGIRAWLHFDLMRLFHPSYNSNSEFIGIPYRTVYTYEIPEYHSSQEVIEFVLKDLNEAMVLIQEIDPLFSDQETLELFEQYRISRMNYFAIAGLMARVNLYAGNYADALASARIIIDNGNFSFIEESEILTNKDYVFQSELIFRLYASLFKDNAEQVFASTADNRLHCRIISDRYQGDVVRKNWFEDIAAADPVFWRFNYTYSDDNSYIPILKLGEMILIEAECAGRIDSPNNGVVKLNQIRTARGLQALDTESVTWSLEELMDYIRQEYEREFFGEGQLFYFYKRIDAGEIELPTGGVIEMDDEKYTVPIPMSEQQFGGAGNN
jgi:hypothetical protein